MPVSRTFLINKRLSFWFVYTDTPYQKKRLVGGGKMDSALSVCICKLKLSTCI